MLHLLVHKSVERFFLRASLWMFLRLFPMYGPEVGCSLSVLAIYMLWKDQSISGIGTELSKSASRQEYGAVVLLILLLLAGVGGLCVPFIAHFKTLPHYFHKLAGLVAVLILICGEGWASGEYLIAAHKGIMIGGISANLILGIVAILEMSGLCMGVVFLLGLDLDTPQELRIPSTLVNLVVTICILYSQHYYGWTSVPTAVLISAHLLFFVSMQNDSSKLWKVEVMKQFEK